jgi:hypothetical protein
VTTGSWITNTGRSRFWAALWGLQAVWVFALAAVLAVAPVVAPWGDGADVVLGLACALVAVAAGAAVLGYARGCLQAGLRIDADGVHVANPGGRRSVPLAAVRRFTAGRQPSRAGHHPTPGILVELTDGSTISVWALARDGLATNGERKADAWHPTADRLNALLDSLR